MDSLKIVTSVCKTIPSNRHLNCLAPWYVKMYNFLFVLAIIFSILMNYDDHKSPYRRCNFHIWLFQICTSRHIWFILPLYILHKPRKYPFGYWNLTLRISFSCNLIKSTFILICTKHAVARRQVMAAFWLLYCQFSLWYSWDESLLKCNAP